MLFTSFYYHTLSLACLHVSVLKEPSSESTADTFSQPDQQTFRVKFGLPSSVTLLSKLNLTSGTYIVDLAVKMYQLYSI
jgi:hypothetical protein